MIAYKNLVTSTVLQSVLSRLKKTKSTAEKQKNSKGQTCWDGYKRHPSIKEGPGSCVPIK